MNIYDFFSIKNQTFIPKTPNAALSGIKKGVLPKESFISLSLFLFSPFRTSAELNILTAHDEIQRINELERILSKKNIDLETEVLLFNTLDQLVEHYNPEIALFAAESINLIENKYNKRINELKEIITGKHTNKNIMEIIKLFYNYGYINKENSDVLVFYFEEALHYFDYLVQEKKLNVDLYVLKIRILNTLKRFEESREVLNTLSETDIPYWQEILLILEIEFEAKNFTIISNIVKSIDVEAIPLKYRSRIKLWKI